jgi:hypothetical protein
MRLRQVGAFLCGRQVRQAAAVTELDQPVTLDVTRREALELCAGLRAYLRSMEQHAAGDHYESHPLEELDRLRLHFGQLIWRLEKAARIPGQTFEHSEDAIPPTRSVDWP